jgi:hypothetical protein
MLLTNEFSFNNKLTLSSSSPCTASVTAVYIRLCAEADDQPKGPSSPHAQPSNESRVAHGAQGDELAGNTSGFVGFEQA